MDIEQLFRSVELTAEAATARTNATAGPCATPGSIGPIGWTG